LLGECGNISLLPRLKENKYLITDIAITGKIAIKFLYLEIQVSNLYIAATGNLIDQNNLNSWVSEIKSGDTTLPELAKELITHELIRDADRNYDETISHSEFVNQVYENLHCKRPEKEIHDDYVKQLSSGNQSQSGVLLSAPQLPHNAPCAK
jgi:hypothetical protein